MEGEVHMASMRDAIRAEEERVKAMNGGKLYSPVDRVNNMGGHDRTAFGTAQSNRPGTQFAPAGSPGGGSSSSSVQAAYTADRKSVV